MKILPNVPESATFIRLTPKEFKALDNIAKHNKVDPATGNHFACVCKSGEVGGIGPHVFRPAQVPGVIGALVKKKLLDSNGEKLRMTATGFDLWKRGVVAEPTSTELKTQTFNVISGLMADLLLKAEREYNPAFANMLRKQVTRALKPITPAESKGMRTSRPLTTNAVHHTH